MFRVKADFSQAHQLVIRLERASAIYPKGVVGGALREAVKPMLRVARQEAPIGNYGRERISLRYGKSSRSNEYRRGGATRRDLRIKVLYLDTGPVAYVGVSMKSGKVGWRTHFITRPVSGGGKAGQINTRGNDFIKRTYDRTFSGVVKQLGGVLIKRAEAFLASRPYSSR
ncbi:hypothetical protein [Larkinella humicola]|uniref:HK97 gp10 family phage protein n=1 Tax=Larkinella humicola TaxID=2607654 RepID=A0A5N1JL70_9BACT|nr:hypothetical protein [Larkinella humicola]KAA9357235.1 hypothetical protein F0P93_05725 [Larkinella humicola]